MFKDLALQYWEEEFLNKPTGLVHWVKSETIPNCPPRFKEPPVQIHPFLTSQVGGDPDPPVGRWIYPPPTPPLAMSQIGRFGMAMAW